MSVAVQPARWPAIGWVTRPLLLLVDGVAAVLLLLDLGVVSVSVLYRYGLNDPIEWSDDVARGLMVALAFFGAAGALARGDNVGVAFFVDRLPAGPRRVVDGCAALAVTVTAGFLAWHTMQLGQETIGQTTGSGLPLEWSFFPMGAGCACMAVFGLERLLDRRVADVLTAVVIAALLVGIWYGADATLPDGVPAG